MSRLASRLRACQRAGLTCILSLASHDDAVDVDSERLQAGRWMARSCLIWLIPVRVPARVRSPAHAMYAHSHDRSTDEGSRYRTAEEARLEATAHEAVGGDDQQELRLHPRQDAECGQDDR